MMQNKYLLSCVEISKIFVNINLLKCSVWITPMAYIAPVFLCINQTHPTITLFLTLEASALKFFTRAVAKLQNKTRQVSSAKGASRSREAWGHAAPEYLKSRGSEMLFYAFSVAFFFRKVNLSIASSCLMPANLHYPLSR